MWEKLKPFLLLMRLHKPIGILLLLWPTLWALWLSARGVPDLGVLTIFVAGVIVMRSAGCIINDVADQHVDKYVKRTAARPIAAGTVTTRQALCLFVILLLVALSLVLCLTVKTIELAIIGAVLATGYPFLKRITHLPQVGLGLAFSWGIPMAFAAKTQHVPSAAWILFFTAILWPVIYDTMYAMADRAEDVKIGVKSTAILFAQYDCFIVGCLQILFVIGLIVVGKLFQLTACYFSMLVIVLILFGYQQWLIRKREPQHCFRAFLHNNWVGLVVFLGIVLGVHG